MSKVSRNLDQQGAEGEAVSKNTGGPNVDLPVDLRDYFAIHAPEPIDEDIATQQRYDRGRNPHNDSYKPPLRSREQIIAYLRYCYADALLAERAKP